MNGSRLNNKAAVMPEQDTKRARRRLAVNAFQDSVAVGIDDYNIGSQLKSLRKARNLTLQFVAVETGMSAALLSQIENNNVTPSLKSLSKLASYYQIRLGKLFDNINAAPRYEIFRNSDREHVKQYDTLVRRKQDLCYSLLPFEPRKKMRCSLFELREESGIDSPASKYGETFLYVVAGKVEICKHDECYTVEAGDSVYLDNSVAIAVRPIYCSRAKIKRVEID